MRWVFAAAVAMYVLAVSPWTPAWACVALTVTAAVAVAALTRWLVKGE